MSGQSAQQQPVPWDVPDTFRECLATADRAAADLAAVVRQHGDQLLIPVAEVEFLARRVAQLVDAAHAALPPEVI